MVPLGSQTLQYFQLSNRANYCGVWDFRTGINGQCRIRLERSSDIAIGNVVGSNIFNALMIVGCTAAIVPISVTKGTLSKEIPLCVLASIVLFICANIVLINGASHNSISSSDGMLLLCFFAIFPWLYIRDRT